MSLELTQGQTEEYRREQRKRPAGDHWSLQHKRRHGAGWLWVPKTEAEPLNLPGIL